MKKNLLVFVLTLIASISVNAASMNSSHRITGDISTSTEVDQFTFSVLAGTTVTFDVLSHEVDSFTNAFVDLDGNNQVNNPHFDSAIFLFDSLGQELANNDDMGFIALLNGSDTNGSVNFLDSFLNYTFASAGIYTLAIIDNENGLSGANIFAGLRSPGDTGSYIIDIIGDGPITLNPTVSPVPVPAAAWLFGSALLGFVGLRRKKQKQAA